jgi:hypothetical protein
MVETYRMPPPSRNGGVAGRFPLDPKDRAQIVRGIEHLLGAGTGEDAAPRQLRSAVWLSIVRDVAAPLVAEDRLRALTQSVRGEWPAGVMSAGHRLLVRRTSQAVCTAIAEAEHARPSGARTMLAELPDDPGAPLGPAERRRIAARLLAAVYGGDPSAAELADADGAFARIRATTGGWSDAWIGLCTAHLAGPRLLYAGADP